MDEILEHLDSALEAVPLLFELDDFLFERGHMHLLAISAVLCRQSVAMSPRFESGRALGRHGTLCASALRRCNRVILVVVIVVVALVVSRGQGRW